MHSLCAMPPGLISRGRAWVMLANFVALRYNGPVLTVFLNVILPNFLVAGSGALFQRWRKLSVGALNQVTLYLFIPPLIFDALLNVDPAAGLFVRLAGAMLLIALFIGVAGLLVSLALRHSRSMRSAFLLCVLFPNAGNMALPVTLLAFGDEGLALAAILFVVQAVLSWSVGVLVASQSELHGLDAIKQVLRVPVVYAVLAAALVLATGWELPPTLAYPISLLARGAFPAMLLVLGFHLASGLEVAELPSLLSTVALRLALTVPLAYLATLLLGLEGLAQQVVIVMASMPPAVFTTIVSTEFNANPRFVTSAVVATSLASLGTLTLVITGVQRWLG